MSPLAGAITASSVMVSPYALASCLANAFQALFSTARISSFRSPAIDGETMARANSSAPMDDFIASPHSWDVQLMRGHSSLKLRFEHARGRARVALAKEARQVSAVGRDCARTTRKCLYARSSRHTVDLAIMSDFTRPRPGAALGFEESNFYLKASFFIAWRTDKE